MIKKIFALALIGVLAAVRAQVMSGVGLIEPTPATESKKAPESAVVGSEDEVERLPVSSTDIDGYNEDGLLILREDNLIELLQKHHPMLVVQYSKSDW